MNVGQFYSFLENNRVCNEKYNYMNDNQKDAIVDFIQKGNPETNIDKYFSAVIDAAQYPNGLKDLQLQSAKDGFEAMSAVNRIANRSEKTSELLQQIEKVKQYIQNCSHEDLKSDFSLIPDGEKNSVIEKVIKEFDGRITSGQLRTFMHNEANRCLQEQNDRYNAIKVNVKTSHAEILK